MEKSIFKHKEILLHKDKNIGPWMDVHENKVRPFIHKLQTVDSKYLLDVNTNEILKVDNIAWDIIDDFGNLNKEQIAAKYITKYGNEKINIAYDNIVKTQQKDNLLLARYPQIVFPYSKETAAEKLIKNRRQLILNVTENCNFRCSYCTFNNKYGTWRDHSKRNMTWKVAKTAIDEFLACDIASSMSQKTAKEPKVLSFYGGEPLLNFPLIKKSVEYIHKEAKTEKIMLVITTNGYLLNGEIADFLISKNFLITVSLDGPSDIHDRNRVTANGSGTWEIVVNNVKNLIKKYPLYNKEFPIQLNAVLTPSADALEIERYFTTCDFLHPSESLQLRLMAEPEPGHFDSLDPEDRAPKGYSFLYENFINNLATGRINSNPYDREFSVQRALFERPYILIHRRYRANPANLPHTASPLSTCLAGEQKTFVSVDGDYYPCEKVPELDSFKIGNVWDGINIDKSYELLKNFFEYNKEQCKYCWCVNFCAIGCYVNVCDKFMLTKEAKINSCAHHRKALHIRLINYCNILEKTPSAFDYMKDVNTR
ncbi:MAG: radical SAM protein [Planctomycetota bacterium]|jgi:uncharacterized protein